MTVSTTYPVAGMTCDHCVNAVVGEVGSIAGVTSVTVDLATEGPSAVTVTSASPLDLAHVVDAVREAGYELAANPR